MRQTLGVRSNAEAFGIVAFFFERKHRPMRRQRLPRPIRRHVFARLEDRDAGQMTLLADGQLQGATEVGGAPNALAIVQKALLASASVPGVFPAVVCDVEVDGQQYQELHADGGVISQDTTLGDWQYNIRKSREARAGSQRISAIYLIRNGRVEPEPEITEFNILGLSGRAVSTLIKMQGIGDIVTAYGSAVISGADFRVTWIGRDFKAPYREQFDPGFMKALYQYGYDLMIAGEAWETKPLMLMSDEERRRSPRMGGRAPAS